MAVAMDNAILENILRQVRPLIGQGKVADYIPALATVDGSRLGIAICTVDGQLFQAGDAQERFSIQSISKVLSLVVAMRHYSEEIRKGVELQPFTWQQKTLYLTVSIGVGSGCASYRTLTDDFNKLMVEADTCLYRSKKDGRNRTSTMRYGEEVV